MNNVYDYESPRAEELPQDFIADLLDVLTKKQNYIFEIRAKAQKIEDKYLMNCAKQEQARLNGALEILEAVGLHAVYGWAGGEKRQRYIFPSFEDCEMQADWLEQVREN